MKVPVSVRLPPQMKRQLDHAAASGRRSLTQEIELRLELSFAKSDVEARIDEMERRLRDLELRR